MKARAGQPHFAEIKQAGLSLIALQVCCYWMTCKDGFEIHWEVAWMLELNLQLAVPSDAALHSARLPLLRWKYTETLLPSVSSKKRMSPKPFYSYIIEMALKTTRLIFSRTLCAWLFRMIFQLSLFTLFGTRKEHWSPYVFPVIQLTWGCWEKVAGREMLGRKWWCASGTIP